MISPMFAKDGLIDTHRDRIGKINIMFGQNFLENPIKRELNIM